MSEKAINSSIRRNFVMNVLLAVSSILFPLITFPYVSRILLPEGTGKVAFATSLISYAALISQLGVPTYGVRACAKVRDNPFQLAQTVQELLIINLCMSILVYLVLFGVIMLVPYLYKERALYFVMSSSIFLNAIGMEWLYKGLEQYTYITIRSLVFKIFALVAMFLFIRKQSDYVLYGGLSIFATSASNILNFFHARRFILTRRGSSFHFYKHFRAVIVFFAMSCAVTIYTHIDSTMLGILVGDAEVGYYDAAVKVRTALMSVVTSLGVVLLPRASYYIEKKQYDKFMHVSTKAMKFVFLLAVPLVVYFILFAKQSIYLLSGKAFHTAILPMRIILPTVLLVGVTNILGIQMLVPLGKEKIVLHSEIAGAVVDLIVNALLIPIMGASGAAVGTLAAETIVFWVQYEGLEECACKIMKEIHYRKILLATFFASIVSVWVGMAQWGDFVTLVCSAFFFFGVYFMTMILLKEPMIIDIWHQVLGRIYKKTSV